MVFPDLSAPQVKPHKVQQFKTPSIAPVGDRLLSFLLDFLIFSPIVGLLLSTLIRQAKVSFLIYSSHEEALVSIGLMVFIAVLVSTCIQSAFLFYFQATPGQMFTGLRVISYPESRAQVTLNQCIIRSLLWWVSALVCFFPFIEVLSHPLRRAFHERGSDTLVVTCKKNSDTGPLPMESRFFASWMRMSFLLLLCTLVMGAVRSYRGLLAGEFRSQDATTQVADSLCPKNQNSDQSEGIGGLDLSLTLYLAEAITKDCLSERADQVLWGSPSSEAEALAYLAKYLVNEGEKKQNEYLKLICKSTDQSACSLARYMGEDGSVEDLNQANANLLTSKFLLADEFYVDKKFSLALKLLNELQENSALESALEKRYVRSIWSLNEEQKALSGRRPASQNQDEIEEFKEKYELP